jgi:hypothetical protein
MAGALVLTATLLLGIAAGAAEPRWTPGLWVDENTVELRTTRAGEAPHWFKVWVAVVDDQLYVRIGSRAAERIERNTTAPEVAVRIAGQEFEHVQVENAPDMADRVAAELAEKYWTDVLIRHFSHPLTLRLVPK